MSDQVVRRVYHRTQPSVDTDRGPVALIQAKISADSRRNRPGVQGVGVQPEVRDLQIGQLTVLGDDGVRLWCVLALGDAGVRRPQVSRSMTSSRIF
jgi:hypothetical protein